MAVPIPAPVNLTRPIAADLLAAMPLAIPHISRARYQFIANGAALTNQVQVSQTLYTAMCDGRLSYQHYQEAGTRNLALGLLGVDRDANNPAEYPADAVNAMISRLNSTHQSVHRGLTLLQNTRDMAAQGLNAAIGVANVAQGAYVAGNNAAQQNALANQAANLPNIITPDDISEFLDNATPDEIRQVYIGSFIAGNLSILIVNLKTSFKSNIKKIISFNVFKGDSYYIEDDNYLYVSHNTPAGTIPKSGVN